MFARSEKIRAALASLELDERATPDDVRRAYRDLVKVWHPDRFAEDARLREKADRKLAAINAAYEALRSSLETGGSASPGAPEEKGPSESSDGIDPATSRRALPRGFWIGLGVGFALFVLPRAPVLGGLLARVAVFVGVALVLRGAWRSLRRGSG